MWNINRNIHGRSLVLIMESTQESHQEESGDSSKDGVPLEKWEDWKWQLQNRITTRAEIEKYLKLTNQEKQAFEHPYLSFAVTPYYLSLIDVNAKNDPIRKAVIPSMSEVCVSKEESEDPLHEDDQSPVEGLVHRYPDRVLFLTTDFCSVNCRYCCRSRMVGKQSCMKKHWAGCLKYIRKHTEIRDVILSGGDVFTLPDNLIEELLTEVFSIKHVEMVRLGTKVPAVLPQRITPELCAILKKFKPLYISIHAMHPKELTPEFSLACDRLAEAGVVMGSQTVLLKGINDDVETMRKLMTGLLKNRVRPYYIYRCDKVAGTHHFRTALEKGIEIIKGLRGYISGYGVPQYIVDSEHGKVAVGPENAVCEKGKWKLTSYEGHVMDF